MRGEDSGEPAQGVGDPDDSARAGREPAWDRKLVLLNDVLAERHLSYAFGGAIALNYHREPRATLDIDINIFVSTDQQELVIAALSHAYRMPEVDRIRQDLRRDGQARTIWGDTYVDIFLANTEFHQSMERRVEHQPFEDRQIPVISIEDLVVCKALFDRPKDWLDLEAVVNTRTQALDRQYIMTWLGRFLEPEDHRLQRLEAMLAADALDG